MAFWLTDDYDSPALQSNPLLHTWSLGVEEQFYVVLSLLFFALAFRHLKILMGIIMALSIFSFYFTIFWWSQDASASFYLLFGRFWELGAGVILAFLMDQNFNSDKKYSLLAKFSSYAGLAVILYYLVSFELTSRHPGPGTLGLVVATCLIIVTANSDSIVNKFLSSRLFVSIGNASYSVYLWHWPSAILIGTFQDMSIFWKLIIYLVVSFGLGYLSRLYVELPWLNNELGKNKSSKKFQGRVLSSSALIIFSLTALVLTPNQNVTPIPQSNNSESDERKQTEAAQNYLSAEQFLSTHERPNLEDYCGEWTEGDHIENYCEIGDPNGMETVLLVGDSHALSMLDFLDNHLNSRGQSGLFGYSPGCPSLPGLYPDRKKTSQVLNCYQASENLLKTIDSKTVDHIWLVNRWDYYIGAGGNLLSDQPEGPFDLKESRELAKESIMNLIGRAIQANVGLTIYDQPPQQPISPRDLDLENLGGLFKIPDSRTAWIDANSITKQEHDEMEILEEQFFEQVFAESASDKDHLFIQNDEFFCDDIRCRIGDDSGLYYFDDDHLSIHGVKSFFASESGVRMLEKLND